MTATGLADVMPADRITTPEEDAGLLARLASAGHGRPEAVLHPTSTSEVVEVMRWATANGVGVLPIASGARLRPRRAASDARRWVILRTDRLAGVEIYEAADLTLTAGAGTPMRDLDGALRANGQWAPFDPPHALERSLGGLVADATRGPLWTGYGELRNHVLGMTVVTGDGRLLRLGGRVVKNVAGFDLLKPMTGSRGALAVMTSVTVRAFPRPRRRPPADDTWRVDAGPPAARPARRHRARPARVDRARGCRRAPVARAAPRRARDRGGRPCGARGPPGQSALAVSDAFSGGIDLLVTDVMMAGMDGSELAAALLERRPRLALVYVSGHPRDGASPDAKGPPGRFLRKPFEEEELLHEVRRALELKRLS